MPRYATNDALYFLTATVVDWVDIFTRREYKDFIVESLDFCRTVARRSVLAPPTHTISLTQKFN